MGCLAAILGGRREREEKKGESKIRFLLCDKRNSNPKKQTEKGHEDDEEMAVTHLHTHTHTQHPINKGKANSKQSNGVMKCVMTDERKNTEKEWTSHVRGVFVSSHP